MEPTIINSATPSNAEDGILEDRAARSSEPLSSEPAPEAPGREGTSLLTFAQMALVVLGAIAFLYFARPVVLPIVLAVVAAMTLKPLVRWLSECHLPPAFAAAIVLCVFVSAVVIGFLQLGRPAVAWINEGPAHIAQLRQRVEKMFPRLVRFGQMAAAVNNLGATEQSKATPVEIKTTNVPSVFINWTGAFLAGVAESLVLLYLLLASGDLFLQKLVRVMPTFGDKKRAVEISREMQQNITNYLFSVSLINIVLGLVVSGGLFWMGVPNAVMWGVVVACLNFVPYFGPIAGILLLGAVGFLHIRHLVERTPACRLVSRAAPAGILSRHPGSAGESLHSQPGGDLCFADVLDLALGGAWGIIGGADTGVDQSDLRSPAFLVNRLRTAQS